MAQLVQQFGAGRLISAKGIAEGVENSNYLVETDQGRFIFTVYEKRVDPDDLPFFFAMIATCLSMASRSTSSSPANSSPMWFTVARW